MRRLRPALFVAGLAGLVGALSCAASPLLTTPSPAPSAGPAIRLLQAAARTSMTRPWTGLQQVLSVTGGLPRLSLVRVGRTAATGSEATALSADLMAIPTEGLDDRMLDLLADHFDLVVAGEEVFAGRLTRVLEARRRDGQAGVAGRFWVDEGTGMVLRRDVLDPSGGLARSTLLEDLAVGPPQPSLMASSRPSRLDETTLHELDARGWPVQRALPGGLDLFDARFDGGVLQLSYSDGLSTLSLFVQDGQLTQEPAGTPRPLGDDTVWVDAGTPERVVWSGDGRTWTLVSDAPGEVVDAALHALPHTPRRSADGPAARVWRGLAVVGSWLNPFD